MKENGWDKYGLAEDPVPVDEIKDWGAGNATQKVTFKTSALQLDQAVYSNIRIQINDPANIAVKDLKAVVKDSTGKVIETIEGENFTNHTSANNYFVQITKIAPKDMGTVYTVQLFVGEEAVSTATNYSVASYVRRLQDKGYTAGAIAMAVLRYGTAAARLTGK